MPDNEDPRGGAVAWLVGVLVGASVVLFLVFSLRGPR